MSATIAIAAGMAAYVAEETARTECIASMAAYEPHTATVEQARHYAGCVYRIHSDGEPIGAGLAIIIKILIVSSFVCAAVGAVRGWRDDGLITAIMIGMLAACAPWVVAFFLFVAVLGVQFVVSA
jgi:hypothetical protein